MSERIQRYRMKGWRMREGAVYVGRPSLWGNPYSLDDMRAMYPEIPSSDRAAAAVRLYRRELEHFGLLSDYAWYVSDEHWSEVGRAVMASGAVRHQPRSQRGTGPRLARVEPKTERARVVALPGFVSAALSELSHDAIYVFHRGNGKPLNPSTVQRAFAAATGGLPRVRLHDCRHTAATLMLASGASLDDVKRALGHTSIAITSDVYGHLVEGRARELAARLDEAIGGLG